MINNFFFIIMYYCNKIKEISTLFKTYNMSAQLIEIIFYIIIAFFVISKLHSILGMKIEEENESNNNKDKEKADILKQISQKNNEPEKDESKIEYSNEELMKIIYCDNKEKILNQIEEIKETYPHFLIKNFIQSATKTYELIINSFCNKEYSTIKKLCTDRIYNVLIKKANKLEQKQQQQHNKIIKIDNFIIDIYRDELNLKIVLKFYSKQFFYITDKEENLILGNKSQYIDIEEYFTFTKKINEDSNIWLIDDIK